MNILPQEVKLFVRICDNIMHGNTTVQPPYVDWFSLTTYSVQTKYHLGAISSLISLKLVPTKGFEDGISDEDDGIIFYKESSQILTSILYF